MTAQPATSLIRRNDTHRLIHSKYSDDDSSVLAPLADSDGHLAGPEHALVGTDEKCLRGRGALVNRQDVHAVGPPDDDSVYASSASRPCAPCSVRMAAGSSNHWTA